MQTLRNKVIASAAVVILAAVGFLMNSHQAAAQGPPDGLAVKIVNPLPVPVTGSTSVSGTVAATQSGAWNVSVTGTPSVQVTNPATAPVLFLNVNDPGRIPFQQGSANCPANFFGCTEIFGPVPTNHRLVVEHLSARLTFSNSASAKCTADVRQATGGFYTTGWTASTVSDAAGVWEMIVDQPVRIYVDQNNTLALGCVTSQVVQGGNISATGYLLDCITAPCAAIASFGSTQ
jgi:hypothetical protein